MPSGPFAHVCLLVKDLDQAIADWTKILAVLDPGQVEREIVRYEEFEGGEDQMRWATFVSDHGAEIQLMEPQRDTPLGRRLEKIGEHVHHICFTTDDPAAAVAQLGQQGLDVDATENQDPSMPWQRWSWILPQSAHGTLVEVARPYKAVGSDWHDGSV